MFLSPETFQCFNLFIIKALYSKSTKISDFLGFILELRSLLTLFYPPLLFS